MKRLILAADRCQKLVTERGLHGFYQHQCSRRIKVRRDGNGYCNLHDPMAVEQRRDARHREWQSNSRRKQQAFDLRENAIDAIKRIAAGHGDPASLARTVLDGTYELDAVIDDDEWNMRKDQIADVKKKLKKTAADWEKDGI